MPSVSEALNTAPLYSSENPYFTKLMLLGPEHARMSRQLHPEIAPIIITLTEMTGIFDYANQVVVHPEEIRDYPVKALLAQEGESNSRILIKSTVKVFDSEIDEYNSIKATYLKTRQLPDFVSTTDRSVEVSQTDPGRFRATSRLIHDQPEKVVIGTDTSQPAYLVLLDLFSKGWSARVDGTPTPLHRGYLGARFVHLPAGAHEVTFEFRIPGLNLSLAASGVMLVALLLTAWIGRKVPLGRRQ
jgi:hypothetical protein